MSEEIDDIATLRQKNIAERDAFLATLKSDPLFDDVFEELNSAVERLKTTPSKPRKRQRSDNNFKFSGHIPLEKRKSARLENKKPVYTYLDLPAENKIPRDSDDVDNLEEVVFRVSSRRKSTRSVPSKTLSVEEVTEEMLANVQTSGIKVYGAEGSSCHQCRQKTIDTKTVCRSGDCIGVRGQFCGICVINRYGEDPIKALKDPNWKCYVCRGCCNCSFCRLKQGKRPTGILTPLAKSHGYKSVMDFLHSLQGFGDYPDLKTDAESLLGFDGHNAFISGKKQIEVKPAYDVEEFIRFAKM